MPPPLPAESDVESVVEEQTTPTPASASAQANDELNDAVMEDAKAKGKNVDVDNEDSSDDEEGDGEIYVVEKIVDHRTDFEDGKLRYWVAWKGYPKKSDRTWQEEEDLAGAREVLESYWESIGGKPTLGEPKIKKPGRKSLDKKRSSATLKDEAEQSESPAPKKQKRGRKSNAKEESEEKDEDVVFRGYVDQGADDWKPPQPKKDAWDPLLQKVDTIEQDDSGDRWVYVCWNDKNPDGRFYRSKAKLATVYKAAPQKMLFFYEQHLVFTDATSTQAQREAQQNGADL